MILLPHRASVHHDHLGQHVWFVSSTFSSHYPCGVDQVKLRKGTNARSFCEFDSRAVISIQVPEIQHDGLCPSYPSAHVRGFICLKVTMQCYSVRKSKWNPDLALHLSNTLGNALQKMSHIQPTDSHYVPFPTISACSVACGTVQKATFSLHVHLRI